MTRPLVRIWDDTYAYKKMFVLMGFDALRRRGAVDLVMEPYEAFERRGAPAVERGDYQSHKNIVVAEVDFGGKAVRMAYDANDIYYKIPNRLLRWAGLYFKSNYQEDYLRSGGRLRGEYWEALPFFANLLPEPLDVSQAGKFRRANFSMELYGSFWRNRMHLAAMNGLWHRGGVERKRADVFFIGRYWSETKISTLALVDAVRDSRRKLAGGIVESGDPIPDSHRAFRTRAVSLGKWGRMAADAKVSVVTRGLQGCVGFKPLNLLMAGAPFIANRLMSNLVEPLVDGVNYLAAADDFSDLPEKLDACTPERLREMGRANRDHWNRSASPEATARYLLAEAEKLA